MNSILKMIQVVCGELYAPMIEAVFGKPGVDALFQIMDTAQLLYRHIELERVIGQVVIYRIVNAAGTAPSAIPTGPAANFAGFANVVITDLVLELASDGRAYVRDIADETLETLAKSAVVYHYRSGEEVFRAGTEHKPVVRLDSSARSQFSVPTFSSLRDALQNYAHENVRESTCYVFKQVWHDPNRLFFKTPTPEATIRNSLTQFLRNRLGADHDVWPEQNVNERNPVDIQVKPRFANNRVMLIEIKWLGFSVADNGHITARHSDSRAQKGADQLAEYLDQKLQFAPTDVIQAYYVIIDGRRQGLREGDTTVTRSAGLYYEDKELSFNPAPHETRTDFDPPYRMFARPVCSD